MTPKKVSKSFFANGQVGRISGADLISLLDTGKLLAVDTRPVEDWKMGSLSHRFSVIFDVGILQSSCCYLLCANQCHGALGSIRRCGKAAPPLLAFLAFLPTSLPSNT